MHDVSYGGKRAFCPGFDSRSGGRNLICNYWEDGLGNFLVPNLTSWCGEEHI